MASQTKGKCKYCGKEFAKGYMLRHLRSCKERKTVLEGEMGKRKCGYFTLAISGKYEKEYWLIVEIRDTALLSDLDQFIRDIWVECCGHLSEFDIYGQSYESDPVEDTFWGPPAKSMNYKLKDVLDVGMTIAYEYDFGSTTELVIEVKDHREGVMKNKKIQILSRNEPIKWICDVCKKRAAVYIDIERYYEEGTGFLCEECSEDEEYEDAYLSSVCNSPRMGVCGYDGSEEYSDEFIPDKEI